MELIHTCYRIGDIDRSVAFYEALGFEEIRRMPIREEAINVFMGLPDDGARLELTYNHGVDSYEMGTGYNHIAITASDLDATLERLGEQGIEPEKPPYRVREALDALVENALRASPPGAPVTVTVRREGDEVAFAVRDRGVGIDPDDLARLFEPFARPRGDRGRGTGLGLAIVRAIAQAHRGSVDADSAPGRGSVFTLRLGPARAATPVAPAAPAPSAQPVSMISMR